LKSGLDVPRCKVGGMGVTFKENCPDIRNSKVADIVAELKAWGAQVGVSDPLARSAETEHEYGFCLEEISADKPVDAVILAVGHRAYKEYSAQDLRAFVKGDRPIIADVKGLSDKALLEANGLKVFRL